LVVENRISDCGVVEILSIDRYQNKWSLNTTSYVLDLSLSEVLSQ
jgi:hypothetical protein